MLRPFRDQNCAKSNRFHHEFLLTVIGNRFVDPVDISRGAGKGRTAVAFIATKTHNPDLYGVDAGRWRARRNGRWRIGGLLNHERPAAVAIAGVFAALVTGAHIVKTGYLIGIGIVPTPTDRTRFMSGVGGREAVIEKRIQKIAIGDLAVSPFLIQLGSVDYGLQMNGIIGIDFLLAVGATIDFRSMTLH